MTERTVVHETFVIERVYPVPPSRVFNAYADRETKARWFDGPPEMEVIESSLDFRVGGRERNVVKEPGSPVLAYDAVYWDIVPNERIVMTYDMHLDGKRISVSVATTELLPEGDGTRLIYTEQGAFLDGLDSAADRQKGSVWLLDALGELLASEA
jgi:uncharacterized protein YndB with AHSA1/START domain